MSFLISPVSNALLRTLSVISFALFLGACQSPYGALERSSDGNEFRIATFNIHYVAENQKSLDWDRRKQAAREAFGDLDADIVAFQEMETFAGGSFNQENRQLDWMSSHFPEYEAGAYGDARSYPNTQPVLYRRSRFRQVEQGFFFFSDTPDVIYSRTFNGSWPAFCSWTRLVRNSDGRELYVFNVHFEYRSMSNRSKSAKLVADRIRSIVPAGQAIVLVGDTNAFSFAPTMKTLRAIPLTIARPDGPTFHFNRGLSLLPAIDHVLYSDTLEQSGATKRLRNRYDGVWPSDHYPVVVDFRFR